MDGESPCKGEADRGECEFRIGRPEDGLSISEVIVAELGVKQLPSMNDMISSCDVFLNASKPPFK